MTREFEIDISPYKESGHFIMKVDEKTWLIDISKEGLKFNKEIFPTNSPNDFANAFIKILEQNFHEEMKKLFEANLYIEEALKIEESERKEAMEELVLETSLRCREIEAMHTTPEVLKKVRDISGYIENKLLKLYTHFTECEDCKKIYNSPNDFANAFTKILKQNFHEEMKKLFKEINES